MFDVQHGSYLMVTLKWPQSSILMQHPKMKRISFLEREFVVLI